MAVRTKRLFGPTVVSGVVVTTLYTCPSGETAIVKLLTVAEGPGAPDNLFWYIGGSAISSQVLRTPFDANTAQQVATYLVLGPNDDLRCGGAVLATSITVTGHGVELEGVAD